MSCKQIRFLWVGIILFVLANSYAPWSYVKPTGEGFRVTVPAGRYCIFDTPKAEDGAFGLKVDLSRVAIQSAVIAALTLGLMAICCDHKKDDA